MKFFKITTLLIATMFLRYNGQEIKSNTITTDCETLFSKQLDNLWTQLGSFQSNYLPDEKDQSYKWDYNFSKKEITVFQNETLYLKIDFIHVGSINAAQKTWTWSKDLKEKKELLYKVYEYGLMNECEKLTDVSWSGGEKDAWKMVAMTNHIFKSKGGARHYTPLMYNYVVFTKIQKL